MPHLLASGLLQGDGVERLLLVSRLQQLLQGLEEAAGRLHILWKAMGLYIQRHVACGACLVPRKAWVQWPVHACWLGNRRKSSLESWVDTGNKAQRL